MTRKVALISLFLPALAFASIPKSAVQQALDTAVKIRVRVNPGAPLVQVRGFDLRVYEAKSRLASAPDRQSEWQLRCGRGRVTAHHGKQKLELAAPVSIQTPAGFLSLHGRPYRGEILVYPSGSKCEVVNQVDLEKYLDGLVNSEFNANWPEQGIAAQIIAARTYAYYQMQDAAQRGKHFDVDSTEKDQVYDGSLKEDFRSSRAVEKTRGIVLAVNDSGAYMPVKAFYHSTCGGMTELPEKVWGTYYPGFKRVRCPFCNSSPRFRWELDLSSGELSRSILKGAAREANALGWPQDWKSVVASKDLLEIESDESEGGGRPNRVVMHWRSPAGKLVQLSAPAGRVRNWLGSSNFRSTSFKGVPILRGLTKYWHFEGRGNGHGVGMCQWGAKVMGEKGYTATSILRHYYPGAVLRKLW